MEPATLSRSRGWRPGARAARLRASHSYGFVLALVVAMFVFAATAPDTRWASVVVLATQTVTLVTAAWTSGIARRALPLAGAVIPAAVAAGVADAVWGGTAAGAAASLLTGLLTLAAAGAIAVGVMDQAEVNAQSMRGAICIYLLIGLLFVSVYGAVAQLGHGPLFAQGTDGTRSLRLYFSFSTLATLGYGDYTPAGPVGRTLALVEALLGQLYLVTVVALLVSRIGRRRRG